MSRRPSVRVDEPQALFFRARRTHLAGPGAVDVGAAARSILGAQAQQENPALFAISLRTAGRPTAAAVRSQILEDVSRRLVRTWGHRDTLHIYALEDWRAVIASLPEWPQSGRRGGMPTPEDLAIARTAFAEAAEPIFRRDLFDLVPQRYVDELVDHPGAGGSPERALILAATRLIWCLAKSGELCLAHKQGAEQAYVLRRHWVPELPWPAECDPVEAATDLARRYLRSFAPATPADMAHFFGSKVGTVRVWLEGLELVLADVTCGDRRGLLALAEDLEELAAEPPAAVREWPLRLLPQWDLHTMTHKDKSWVVPHQDDLQLVWRKAAVNAPTVVVRGRFVATWSHRTTTRRVFVKVSPLSGWRARFRSGVEREAKELAAHLGLEEVEIELA